jgi:dTMP kinase
MSLFITFEGIEGSGKSTQIGRLAERLRRRGAQVVVTREPGGCPIADAIRRILLHPDSSALVPRAELLLYAAARAQHVDEVIRPALAQGKIVLCDRFVDATVAYQGEGRGLDANLIASLNDLAADGLLPHLTLLLDMPVEVGLRRARDRNSAADNGEDRFERESLAFHDRVRAGYLKLARREKRFRIIDADAPVEEVADRINRAVDDLLGRDGS